MRNDQHLAIDMRKKGKSYKEISRKLGIPKSTMHYWFKNLQWSEKIKDNLTERSVKLSRKRIKKVIKANKERWLKWREDFKKEAAEEFPKLRKNPTFIAGLMLYWGEGDSKLKNTTRLTNTDPRMISLFCKFVVEILKVPRSDIKAHLTIYPDLSDSKCKKYWSKETKLPINQFNKTQVIYGKHPTRRLENGICSIRVPRSCGLKEKIFVWIDLFSKE
ncbi:MAG TPA: helix-turn-helix domain-containing protein [Candidatus Bathyarchaeia archaeon]|nr:helix-turn-helix domain-containing protein [Candidatus Bathyarchaeia archaeon]